MKSDLSSKIASLPLTSGVYLMKDAGGRIIYIGKAVNLRRRVKSYFRGHVPLIREANSVRVPDLTHFFSLIASS